MISASAFGIVVRSNVLQGDCENVIENVARCCLAKISVGRREERFRRSACVANSQHFPSVVNGNLCREVPLGEIVHTGSVTCGIANNVTSSQGKQRNSDARVRPTNPV